MRPLEHRIEEAISRCFLHRLKGVVRMPHAESTYRLIRQYRDRFPMLRFTLTVTAEDPTSLVLSVTQEPLKSRPLARVLRRLRKARLAQLMESHRIGYLRWPHQV